MNTLTIFFKNLANIYNSIYNESNSPTPLPWSIGKTLSSNFEGIVIPSDKINKNLYEGCIVEAGEEICTVTTLEGYGSEVFRADQKCRIIKLNVGEYIGVGDQVAIIQPLF